LAEGSPGRALNLTHGDGLKLAQDAEDLISAGVPDFPTLLALAERIAKLPDGLTDFGQHLAHSIARQVPNCSFGPKEDYRGWIVAWERVNHLFARAKGVYMEPRQTVINSARIVESGRRHSSPL